jgi:Uma2 family endonuclease
MPTEIIKKRFTVDEYHRMGEAGIFGPEERVELIDGEIIQMSPIGLRHAARVARATALFVRALSDRAVIGPQNPVQLSDWTEPQPDIIIFKPRSDFYEHKKPTPDDVLLVMEISDTSLRYDLKVKLPHFAAAGIPEYWIQDVNADILHVFREPQAKSYKTSMQLKRGDSISPLAFPDARFSMVDLLGPAVVE